MKPSKASKQKQQKRTAQLHINPKLHKKFKLFCIDSDKPMQKVTERIITNAMKTPSEVARLASDKSERV